VSICNWNVLLKVSVSRRVEKQPKARFSFVINVKESLWKLVAGFVKLWCATFFNMREYPVFMHNPAIWCVNCQDTKLLHNTTNPNKQEIEGNVQMFCWIINIIAVHFASALLKFRKSFEFVIPPWLVPQSIVS